LELGKSISLTQVICQGFLVVTPGVMILTITRADQEEK
jgi:hypothetical protein